MIDFKKYILKSYISLAFKRELVCDSKMIEVQNLIVKCINIRSKF